MIENQIISIKTKRHKSLGLLCLRLMSLFFFESKDLQLEKAASKIFNVSDPQILKSKVSFLISLFYRLGDFMMSSISSNL